MSNYHPDAALVAADTLVERLRVEHADALAVEQERKLAHERAAKRGTARADVDERADVDDPTLDAWRDAHAYTASVTRALVVAYDERAALSPDAPSQALVAVGERERARLVAGAVPDPMQGAQHSIMTRRSTSGRTYREVKIRGRATVQGSTEWDVDRLAQVLGVEHGAALAFLVDMLASDALAGVRQLTLGADALDVERATSALLLALDVDALDGTEAMAWSHVETAGEYDDDGDTLDGVTLDGEPVDAMTRAVSSEHSETLIALSRHRAGIRGGNIAQRVMLDSASDLDDIADVHSPIVEVKGWPADGPQSLRPGIPSWRKSERDVLVESVERVKRDDDGEPMLDDDGEQRTEILYWRSVETPPMTVRYDVESMTASLYDTVRVVGKSPRRRGVALCSTTVERSRAVLDEHGEFVDVERVEMPHPWTHSADATCQECEHVERVNSAASRFFLGVESVERGALAGRTRKASTRAARQAVAVAAQRRADEIVEHIDADTDRIRAALAVLDVEESREPVKFTTSDERGTVRVTRSSSGFDIRCDGLRVGRPRSIAGAADRIAAVLGVEQ